jgi:hypothetical protein
MKTLVMAMLILACAACSGIRKEQRKDNAAIDRVLRTPKAKDSVWAVIRRERPCVNDTTRPILTQHSQDYILNDTDIVPAVATTGRDSLSIPWGYSKVFAGEVKVRAIRGVGVAVTIPVTDTTRYVKDREEIELWKSKFYGSDAVLQEKLTVIASLSEQNDQLATKLRKFRTDVIVLVVLATLISVGFFVLRLKAGTLASIVKTI